jgi:hypothetical protein
LLDPGNKTGKLYGTTGVPETFIINKDGYIEHKFIGPRDWDDPNTVEALGTLIRHQKLTEETPDANQNIN